MIATLLQRLGVVGALGLLLLAGSGWVWQQWLPQRQGQIDQLASDARRTRHDLLAATGAEASATGDAGLRSPEQAWQRVLQTLPTAAQRVPLQSQVLALASKQGLRISAVRYQGAAADWSATGGTVLWRQRMDMPVEGAYPAVRAWLAALLREPALVLDAVEVQRPDVMTDLVKGHVVVSLWWRQAAEATP